MNQPPAPKPAPASTPARVGQADSADASDEALAAALQASRVMHDAPEAVVERALGLWQRTPTARKAVATAASGLSARLRQLVARLVSDSAGLQPQTAGLRSSGLASTRQLLFTAEDRDLDLRLTPAEDGRHWRVSGQVLGPELQGSATLTTGMPDADPADGAAASQRQELSWDELAEFHFAPVAPGPCTLVLRSADWELVLPLHLPPEPSTPHDTPAATV